MIGQWLNQCCTVYRPSTASAPLDTTGVPVPAETVVATAAPCRIEALREALAVSAVASELVTAEYQLIVGRTPVLAVRDRVRIWKSASGTTQTTDYLVVRLLQPLDLRGVRYQKALLQVIPSV